MSLRLAILTRVFPTRLKLRMLDELADVTARGFDAELPRWDGTSFASRVTEYARFTAHEAGALLARADETAIEAARERLFSGAQGLGQMLRRRLGLRSAQDAFAAFQLLYRQLGIDVGGGPLGDIRVDRCFFAACYSEPVCKVVSALDQGLVAGLFGGASLEFEARLTAGAPCCRATLLPTAAQTYAVGPDTAAPAASGSPAGTKT